MFIVSDVLDKTQLGCFLDVCSKQPWLKSQTFYSVTYFKFVFISCFVSLMHPGHHRFSHPLERLPIKMASQSSFCLAALALSVLLLSLTPPSEADSRVYIYKIESTSTLNGYKVRLQCSFGPGTSGERAIYRIINNTRESITNSTRITFELEPRLEGYYYCQAGNVTSNMLLVLGKSK